jgi:hypothetical protein
MIAEHCREHWMAFTVWITFNRKYMIPIMTCNFQFTSWASVGNAKWLCTIWIDSSTKTYMNLTMTFKFQITSWARVEKAEWPCTIWIDSLTKKYWDPIMIWKFQITSWASVENAEWPWTIVITFIKKLVKISWLANFKFPHERVWRMLNDREQFGSTLRQRNIGI